MSQPSDPQQPARSGPPQTREIPVVDPTTGEQRAAAVPPPGPASPVPGAVWPPTGAGSTAVGPVPGGHPQPPPQAPQPPPAGTSAGRRPEWPDTLADQPAGGPAGPHTGPVDVVPGMGAAGQERGRRRPRLPRGPRRPAASGEPRAARDRGTAAAIALAVLSFLLLQLGLAIGGIDLWQLAPLWSVFATLAALVGVAAVVAGLTAGQRLRAAAVTKVALGAVVGLAVFWLLVVLPVVSSNAGFLCTAALISLGGAVWIGPRRTS